MRDGHHEASSIVVVGSINVDQVVTVARHPLPGETLIGSGLALFPGGKGANQAVAAARLGGRVSMVGLVGSDASQSTLALALLTEAGVDTRAVHTVSGPTGLATIAVAANGENTIVVIPGANALMTSVAVSREATLISAAGVVVMQGEIPPSGITTAAGLVTGRLVLNLAPVIDLDPAVILGADPLVVNEHEARLLVSRLRAAAAPDDAPDDDPEPEPRLTDADAVQWLRNRGVASVVLTRGASGALCSDRNGTHAIAAPRVTAVDSSGAGDAFVGALSTCLARGESLVTAVTYAVRVGAYAVQGHGTQPSYPREADTLPEVPGVPEGPDHSVAPHHRKVSA